MSGNGMDRRVPAPPSRIAGSGLQNQEHSMPHTINRFEAVATIGIDIGKNTFHLVGLDRNGATAQNRPRPVSPLLIRDQP